MRAALGMGLLLAVGCNEAFVKAPERDTDPPVVDDGETDLVDTSDDGLVFDTDTDNEPADVDIRQPNPVPLVDYTLRVDVPALDGLAADLSNLRVLDGSQTALPFWVEDATSAAIQVKVPRLLQGRTDLVLDACDGTSLPLLGPADVFPYVDAFDDVTAWTPECLHAEAFDESCTAEAAVKDGQSTLSLGGISSCFSSPYDGTWSTAARPLPLAAGSWQLSVRVWLSGAHDRFCGGGSWASFHALADGTAVAETRCSLPACATCDSGFQDLVSSPFVSTGADVVLSLQSRSGDCALSNSWVDRAWIRQVATPEPTVTVGAPRP